MSDAQRFRQGGRTRETGFSLIENLVSSLIFTVGVLGLVAAFAQVKQTSGDTQYRIEAGQLAQHALERIWSSVRRDASGNVVVSGDAMSLDKFALSPSTTCASSSGSGGRDDSDSSGSDHSGHGSGQSGSGSSGSGSGSSGSGGSNPSAATPADIVCGVKSRITATGTGLPGADVTIAIDTAAAAYNRVTVTVSWRTKSDSGTHRYEVVGHVN
jgi:Tfp pilus assembly protein PilV